MPTRLLTLLLFMLMTAFGSISHARDVRVHVLYSVQSDVFVQFVHDLRLLATPQLRITAQAVSDPAIWTVPPETELVIVAGGGALQSYALSERRVPVLAVLVSRLGFEPIAATLSQHRIAHSAIYQDPPAKRQLQLAQLLMPTARRVGYLHQRQDAQALLIAQQASTALGLELQNEAILPGESLSAPLSRVLARSDFLLTSADSTIYNSTNIKLLLTATYHADKVLIGTSPALVKAGSLATTFSSTAHIARQTVEWLQQWPDAKGQLAEQVYPDYFDISINNDVARSLNIALPPKEKLLEQLQQMEQTP